MKPDETEHNVMPDLWDVKLEKGESSNNIDRNRNGSNCSNSVHGEKMRRSNIAKTKLHWIRRKWRLQQQRMESHQRRKEILIKEYEIQQGHRLKQSPEGMHLFKGPEGTQIDSTELCKIKVNIYRSIPVQSTVNNELQRDIVNPEDVVVKRREGEGSKPIFAREELTRAVSNTAEVEERRTVAIVKDPNLGMKTTSAMTKKIAEARATEVEIESARRSDNALNRVRKEKKNVQMRKVVAILHDPGREMKQNWREILIIINQLGEDLENEVNSMERKFNRFLFLFITGIFRRDQLWSGLWSQLVDTSLSEASDILCGQ